MKMPNSAIFSQKNLKVNMLKLINYAKLETGECHYAGECRGAAHTICNM